MTLICTPQKRHQYGEDGLCIECKHISPDFEYFDTSGILCKWGFGDGDMLDDFIYDHYEPHQFDPRAKEMEGIIGPSPRDVLYRVVMELVVPKIKNKLEMSVRIRSIHNEIRADKVDGKDVDWYAIGDEQPIKLEPDFVLVPKKEILRIAEEIRISELPK